MMLGRQGVLEFIGAGAPMRPVWEASAPDDTLVLDSVVAPFSIIWGDRREVRWIWTDMMGEKCGCA